MLYIVSQDGRRITDLRAATLVTPEHDREDEGVYKIFVNGAEFARYKTAGKALMALATIKKFIIYSRPRGNDILHLDKDE